MRLSIFFPAYNEEDNIAESVKRVDDVLLQMVNKRNLEDYEIIVVNDGSRDRTGMIADALSSMNHRVRAIHHENNKGYGEALWTGFRESRNDWVFFTDADLQFDMREIPKLISYSDRYKVVIGYRSPRRDPVMRLINAFGWNILNRMMFGLTVRDIDCAFKLFKRQVVVDLPVQTRGAALSAEILIRLQRKGVVFKEVPVTHLPRVRGSATGARLDVIVRAFKELFSLYKGDLGREDVTLKQVGKYSIVGIINTFVDIAVYFVLTRFTIYFSDHILLTKFSSFFVGTLCSFILNRRFTFNMGSKITAVEVAKFYSTIAVTISVNVGLLYLFNSVLGIYDLIAVGLSTGMTFAIGFVISKLWVFRNQGAEMAKNIA